jgi:hypothetical protein
VNVDTTSSRMEVEYVRDLLEDCINRNDFRELGNRLDDAELMVRHSVVFDCFSIGSKGW